jgi:hypothetical protein
MEYTVPVEGSGVPAGAVSRAEPQGHNAARTE